MKKKITKSLIKKLLEAGWEWWMSPSTKTRWLLPPPGDKRHGWAAEYLPYLKSGRVPHWALAEDALTPHK